MTQYIELFNSIVLLLIIKHLLTVDHYRFKFHIHKFYKNPKRIFQIWIVKWDYKHSEWFRHKLIFSIPYKSLK